MATKRTGYTLLELVLVVVIIALLAAIAFPTMDSAYRNLRQNSAADQVRAAWALGRLQAVNEGRPYRFSVIPNKGNFRVAPDSNDFWTGGAPPTGNDPNNQPVVREAALAKGVRLAIGDTPPGDFDASEDTALPTGSVDPGMYVTVVTFLPDGTCPQDVSIVFTSKGARPLLLKLRGLTGAATVTTLDENGQPTNNKP